MFETIKNAFKIKEVRNKILITLGLLLLYRLGCFVPVPGIDSGSFSSSISGNGFLGVMSSISGGALANGTLFAMGVGPYINASIIMQLLCIGIPALEKLSKQGEEGRKKIAQYTRYLTLVLAVVQSVAILISSSGSIDFTILGGAEKNLKWLTYICMTIIFVAGASLTMWIGERITDYGIGNGISLLIFVGILATAGNAILSQLSAIFGGDIAQLWSLLGFLVAVVIVFACIVTVELAERKIPVQYAKQIKGRKMYGGQSTYIPIKVNGSGVMPLIFAFAIISFPDLIINMFWPNSNAAVFYAQYIGMGSYVYPVLLSALIIFFAYFYAMIQFNPDDIAKNIQQYGGFIPGIRPGKPTTLYLKKISKRITLFGAIFLALVALVPSLVFTAVAGAANSGLINAFSTTGLLIAVSCALEFDKQLESQIMMRHYKGFLE